MKAYQFRQCPRPGCRFRFPAEAGDPGGETCPLCGAATRIEALVQAAPEASPPAQPLLHPPLEALLDNIRSAWNAGAIFRSADGAGVSHLHLCGLTPTPENPKVGKTSLGSERSVSWSWRPNGLDHALHLRQSGMRLWALEDGPRAVPLSQAGPLLPGSPIVLIVGNELCGIDPAIQALCDQQWCIPMQGVKRSLNVAVAFSIAVYFLRFPGVDRSAG